MELFILYIVYIFYFRLFYKEKEYYFFFNFINTLILVILVVAKSYETDVISISLVYILFQLILIMSTIDLRTGKVPDIMTVAAVITASLINYNNNEDFLIIFTFMGFFYFSWLALSYILKKEAFGLADIPFFGIMGGMLDLQLFLYAIIIASITAIPFSLWERYKNQNIGLPFYPFLSLGFVIMYTQGM